MTSDLAIPERVYDRSWNLRRFANGLRGLFGQPVYLVGSTLQADNPKPRDWDIRLCLPDHDFALRYGDGRETDYVVSRWIAEGHSGAWTSIRWKWSDDCVKWSLRGCHALCATVDFQVYPEKHWMDQYSDSPRLQIDTRDGDWTDLSLS